MAEPLEPDPPPRPSYRVRVVVTGALLALWFVGTAFSRQVTPWLVAAVDRAEIALGLDISLGKGT
jgi:hypothetical protein